MFCDFVCQVIDNLGDVGVSWRLAVQLAKEHQWKIRFWIDQPHLLDLLVPKKSRTNPNIEVLTWQPGHAIGLSSHHLAFHVVITSFCASLHESDIKTLANTKTYWIHLEYFSCESWVPSFHLQKSPHPQFNITKTIWIPSLLKDGGGIIRENSLQLTEHQHKEQINLQRKQLTPKLFFFTYPQTHMKTWIQNLLEQFCEIDLAPQPYYNEVLTTMNHPKLRQSVFVPQLEFDQHLKQYDLVWVRGEDSVLRALLNGVPFVWHIYPQEDSAHWKKLCALFDVITIHFDTAAKQSLWQIWYTWNAHQAPNSNLSRRIKLHLDDWRCGLHRYVQDSLAQPDLASQLVLNVKETFNITDLRT